MKNLPPIPLVLKDSRRVEIRAPRDADAARILELRLTIAAERAFTATQPHECPTLEGFLRRLHAQAPTHLTLIATAGEDVVGEVNLKPGARERTRHVAELGIHVKADYRSAGLGRALIRAAIEHADPSIEKVSLAVFADHTHAVALYSSLGFREEGRREGQIRLGPGRYVADVLMALHRTPRP